VFVIVHWNEKHILCINS